MIQGDLSFRNFGDAAHLWGGARSFFHNLKSEFTGSDQGEGLAAADDFAEDWSREGKSVFMFSGCKDSQTSADAFIGGKHVGAMSWAFLETMKHDHQWSMSYVQVSFRDYPDPLFGIKFLTSDLNRSSITQNSCYKGVILKYRSFHADIPSI